LAGDARIDSRRLRAHCLAVVESERLESVGQVAGLWIEIRFQPEDRRPVLQQRLLFLNSDARLAEVVRGYSRDRFVGVLLEQVVPACREEVAVGGSMSLVLQAEIDQAVDCNAMQRQAVVRFRWFGLRH